MSIDKKGFTMMELIVTVSIIGVLSTLAVVNYSAAMERSRMAEGVEVLSSILDAVRLYNFENSALPNDIDDIDIEVPSLTYFDSPVLPGVSTGVARLTRNSGIVYTISISLGGVVSCSSATAGYCAKLGY
jgi:prepilin-type N-terminal cleavage/methylation domain-containing protein